MKRSDMASWLETLRRLMENSRHERARSTRWRLLVEELAYRKKRHGRR